MDSPVAFPGFSSFLTCVFSVSLFLSPVCSKAFDLGYVFKSAWGQFKLQNRARDISEVLRNPDLDEKTRSRLELVSEVKKYARDELGLVVTSNYETYVKWDEDYVVWALTASPELELESHKWKFPIVGSFPYLGFFNKPDAVSEQSDMKEKGYDTYLRGVTAYSTLGWFPDPVISTMLRGSEGGFINTIVHESVHTTVYFKNNSDLSEKLAVFIGNEAEIDFLKRKYGKDSDKVRYATDSNHDDRLFGLFMKKTGEQLKELFSRKLPDDRKRELKKEYYTKLKSEITTLLGKMKTRNYSFLSRMNINNANIVSWMGYFSDLSEIEKVYRANNNNLRKTIEHFRKLNEK